MLKNKRYVKFNFPAEHRRACKRKRFAAERLRNRKAEILCRAFLGIDECYCHQERCELLYPLLVYREEDIMHNHIKNYVYLEGAYHESAVTEIRQRNP